MSSSWIDPLIIMYCSSLSLKKLFILKSTLSYMRTDTPAFFCFLFAWNIFFHPLTFGLYVSWGLKWVSCRQHIYGSCFFIHSASLCLLVGAFNPFTFKVIIDIYVPIQRRKWQPTPVLLPGKYHGWRSLVGYSPWGHKESDRTERLHFLSFSSSFWRRKW